MNPFQLVIDANFDNPIMGMTVTYRKDGQADRDVRVIARRDDEFISVNGGTSIYAKSVKFDVRTSECPDIAKGDRFVFPDGDIRVVQGLTHQDADRLIWVVDTHKA